MIWTIIFLTALLILIATFIQNINLRSKYNSEFDLAADNLDHCTNRLNESYKPILELMLNHFGERFASNVSNKKICEGMPSELLILSWGKPGDIKTDYYKGIKSESWFYDSYVNRLGNVKYRTEVYIENNKIAGWRDLS